MPNLDCNIFAYVDTQPGTILVGGGVGKTVIILLTQSNGRGAQGGIFPGIKSPTKYLGFIRNCLGYSLFFPSHFELYMKHITLDSKSLLVTGIVHQ